MEALSKACAVVAGILMFTTPVLFVLWLVRLIAKKVGKGAWNYLPDLCGMLYAVCHCWGVFRSKPGRRC